MSERNISENGYPIIKKNSVFFNKFISLKLEDGKINLYVNNEHFGQCRCLVLHIFIDDVNKLDGIQSIDNLDERDFTSKFNYNRRVEISPKEEFWGHCSNLHAWIENDYDTRLLHRNLAFPLLRELSKLGDLKAKNMFKNEIIERFSSGSIPVMKYLLHEGFLKDFNEEEREYINEGLDKVYATSFFYRRHYLEQGRDVELFDEQELDDNKNLRVNHKKYSNSWSRLPNIKNKITDISNIKELKMLTDITELNLIQNYITEIKGLGQLTYLRELALNRNEITDIEGLEKLTRLRYLSLSGNKITKIKGLEHLKYLEFLYLGYNHIKKIEGLDNLTNLKVLSLENNKIETIEGIENLKDLRELSLGNNQISEIDGLKNLGNLRELYLYNNRISEIKGLDSLKNLRKISFHSNNISKIKGLENLQNLQEVVLQGNPLDEEYVNKFKRDLEKSGVKTKFHFPFYSQG